MKGSDAYRQAGVDTEAGARLVERIKPAVQSTRRAGASPDLGGFGGLFDLTACGFSDPVLVAANDGVGTKLKVALDYFATGGLDVETAAEVVEGIAAGCREAGCALIGGETAEMPSLYATGDYDLAGFCVGAVERGAVLPKGVQAGDVVLGLAASGFHSNGYSLIRKVIADQGLSYRDPSPFDASRTLGEVLLTPTRLYVASVLAAQRETGALKALAHITGGGPLENIPRGVGMVCIVSPEQERSVSETLRSGGETVFRFGTVQDRQDDPVVVTRQPSL